MAATKVPRRENPTVSHSRAPREQTEPHETHTPPFLRLRARVHWWEKHGASPEVLQAIRFGVQADLTLPSTLSCHSRPRQPLEEAQALAVLQEYAEVGAVKPVSPDQTAHLVPWFVITRHSGPEVKTRLISDCRELNQYMLPKHFKLDHWQHIFPNLRRGMWAAKIDLKNAYFHLGLSNALKPYVRIQVQNQQWEFQAACFGLSTLPYLWTQTMKVLHRLWRGKGILCFVYLDDILLLGSSPKHVSKSLAFMLHTLEEAGLEVNVKKSVLTPVQEIDHLGFHINFVTGHLQVPCHKLKLVRRELGKLLLHRRMSPWKMSASWGV